MSETQTPRDMESWIACEELINEKLKTYCPDAKVFHIREVLFPYWNHSFVDSKIIIYATGDVIDDGWFKTLIEKVNEFNLKITVVTDLYFINPPIDHPNIKIIWVPEFYGMYYIPNININYTADKLFSCLMGRTLYQRFDLFIKLLSFENGNLSFLGYTRNTQGDEVNNNINFISKEYDIDINEFGHIELPYKNFEEKENIFEIEQQSKYNIVQETYNDHENLNCICFTEKTFRALQIPNISLFLNKQGYTDALEKIGFKINPINKVSEVLVDHNCQNNFVAGVLKNDYLTLDKQKEFALENTKILNYFYTKLMNDDFFKNLAKLL